MTQRIDIRPCTREQGNHFIGDVHRHSYPVRQAKFWASAWVGNEQVGVACAGLPNAPGSCDGRTIEVLRNCVREGFPNACSMLYGAMCRAAKALGYLLVITYTLSTEPGTSLKAAGFRAVAVVKGRDWSEQKGRRLLFSTGPEARDRIRWEREL